MMLADPITPGIGRIIHPSEFTFLYVCPYILSFYVHFAFFSFEGRLLQAGMQSSVSPPGF